MTIGRDINTFIGYSVFALHKHYTHEQKFNEFQVVADKYWILTDMRVKEEDIIIPPESFQMEEIEIESEISTGVEQVRLFNKILKFIIF